MKEFYDRVQEMDRLKAIQQQAYNDCSRLVVLTGRRRVGKTSLVCRLMQETEQDAPSLYFFVGRKTESVLVQTFAEEVRTRLNEFVPEGVSTMRGLMQLLLEIGRRRRFTVFMDEFQEWDNVNAGVFSDMQELWDKYKRETNICLIVSGSIFRMMEKIFKDEEQPLFGRDDCSIRLMPFTTRTICEILRDYKPDYSSEDLLALWTLTGGVARYIELLMNNGCTDVDRMIHFACSSGDCLFVNEGKNILIQEFGKQYGTYFSILEQIACGDVTQGEIEAATGMKSLGGQMKVLEENYGIIRKKRPIGAKEGSQTVRFEIQDNFFRFWFRYMYRYAALIEIQNMQALERIMKEDYPVFSGFALERWFRQQLMESCRYQRIGGWWKSGGRNAKGNQDDFEIDIVAETIEGEVEAYEVKRNAQKYNPARLAEKVAQMQRHDFRNKKVRMQGLSMDDMEEKD